MFAEDIVREFDYRRKKSLELFFLCQFWNHVSLYQGGTASSIQKEGTGVLTSAEVGSSSCDRADARRQGPGFAILAISWDISHAKTQNTPFIDFRH